MKSAAETFRSNPAVNVVETISTLGVGQALISFLDEKACQRRLKWRMFIRRKAN